MIRQILVTMVGLALVLTPAIVSAQDCVEVDLELTPTAPAGSNATFSAELTNCGSEAALVEIAVSLTLPPPLEAPAILFHHQLGAGETGAFSKEFPVPPIVPAGVYEICVTATIGSSSSSDCAAIEITPMSSGASSPRLGQNNPNPFNLGTTITFTLNDPSEVELSVYNVVGKKVTMLASGQYGVGEHSVEWDGRDSRGEIVASGVYFYRLVTLDGVKTKKMMLMK